MITSKWLSKESLKCTNKAKKTESRKMWREGVKQGNLREKLRERSPDEQRRIEV